MEIGLVRVASLSFGLAAALIAFIGTPGPMVGGAHAAAPIQVGPSGLPLPRFVSLKSGRVNLRIGPGRNYRIDWMYLKAGLPVEIVQEYDTWRRVRDAEGTEGWINQSLLSGKRTAIAAPWQRGKDALITLYVSPDETSGTVATLQPGVVGSIKSCTGDWCQMEFDGHRGWVQQKLIWGAYPGERVE